MTKETTKNKEEQVSRLATYGFSCYEPTVNELRWTKSLYSCQDKCPRCTVRYACLHAETHSQHFLYCLPKWVPFPATVLRSSSSTGDVTNQAQATPVFTSSNGMPPIDLTAEIDNSSIIHNFLFSAERFTYSSLTSETNTTPLENTAHKGLDVPRRCVPHC